VLEAVVDSYSKPVGHSPWMLWDTAHWENRN
jgi:hypothetical protein